MTLRGLQFHAFHGVFNAEKELGQKFIVDLDMQVDLRDAGRTDDLKKTVDYAEVYQTTQHVFTSRRRRLVESAADDIAIKLLKDYPQVDGITVGVKKPHVALRGTIDFVGVQIHRSRKDFEDSCGSLE